MELAVWCTCGYEIRRRTEQALISDTHSHAAEAHNLQLTDV